jgi:hypothetical protein
LNAQIDDIVIFRKKNDKEYLFEYYPASHPYFDGFKSILNGNHELITSEPEDSNTSTNVVLSKSFKERFADWFISQDGVK